VKKNTFGLMSSDSSVDILFVDQTVVTFKPLGKFYCVRDSHLLRTILSFLHDVEWKCGSFDASMSLLSPTLRLVMASFNSSHDLHKQACCIHMECLKHVQQYTTFVPSKMSLSCALTCIDIMEGFCAEGISSAVHRINSLMEGVRGNCELFVALCLGSKATVARRFLCNTLRGEKTNVLPILEKHGGDVAQYYTTLVRLFAHSERLTTAANDSLTKIMERTHGMIDPVVVSGGTHKWT
jgi:hypothetical protein